MENTVLRELTWDPEAGRLRFKDVRYLLIRLETLAAIHRGMAASAAAEVLYRAGYEGGVRSGTHYRKILGLAAEEAVRFMAQMGGQIGWGAMRVAELDPGGQKLVVEVVGSPFAEALRPSTDPVCHLIRGIFGGVAEAVLGWKVAASEESCVAAGAQKCVFVIRSKGG
jgi:predicted hydrocarbon binding protein